MINRDTALSLCRSDRRSLRQNTQSRPVVNIAFGTSAMDFPSVAEDTQNFVQDVL